MQQETITVVKGKPVSILADVEKRNEDLVMR